MKIGIDLGGSHIGIGLISDDLKLLETKYTDFQSRDYVSIEQIQLILKEDIDLLLENNNITVKDIDLIGFATPGVPKGLDVERMVNLKMDKLHIPDLLPKELQKQEIKVHNDGKCSAIAEKKVGSLRGEKDAIFLCLGTGVGSGVFLNGKLLEAGRAPGFEIGHMVIKEDGILCKCGNRGCLETYASMKKFKTDLCNMLDLKINLDGEQLRDILYNLKDNLLVRQVIEVYLNDLTTGIINMVNLFMPETICIGGSFVHFKDFLFDELNQKVQNASYLANHAAPQIKIAKLGNDAGILGSVLMD